MSCTSYYFFIHASYLGLPKHWVVYCTRRPRAQQQAQWGSYSLGNQGHPELATSLKPKYRSLLTLSHSRANLLLSICCVQPFTAVPLCWEGGYYVTPLQLKQDGTQLLDERAAFSLLPAPRETERWFCSSGSPPGCKRRERNWTAFLYYKQKHDIGETQKQPATSFFPGKAHKYFNKW